MGQPLSTSLERRIGLAGAAFGIAASIVPIWQFLSPPPPPPPPPGPARINVYGEPNCHGYDATFSSSQPNLKEVKGHGFGGTGNWENEINSVRVVSGAWVLYKDIDFGGKYTPELHQPGCRNLSDFGIDRDAISSIRLVHQ